MFDSVLIANRGEIAVRIIRTLRALGLRSIVVHSDADADARHVHEADLAVRLSRGYLDIDGIIEAAKSTGARAVHPGYGFLAENAEFARRCDAAGLVFVGPPPGAIEAMGDKIRAKATVSEAGVPVVPGGAEPGDDLIEAGRRIGFPALIKPSAGGGGKGMRLVGSAAELPDAVESARRTAVAAFGDGTLLIEKFVENPRHIEIQIMADTHGNVVHLGERECSLQRRHQKIIEEAPSPLLDPVTRERMGAAAVKAARSVGYVGAGTVEFIVRGAQHGASEFYFMEMNTRLQVEHPVTELVTGLDLVELQLRVAAGEPLPFRQEHVRLRGHAVEARVYAEDPARDFLPTGGHVLALREPRTAAGAAWHVDGGAGQVDGGAGPIVRVDSGLAEGMTVGSAYDPMLSKVIAWAPDRTSALRALDHALAETAILGVTTNISFLRGLLGDPDVVAGRLDTGLVERLLQPETAAPEVPEGGLSERGIPEDGVPEDGVSEHRVSEHGGSKRGIVRAGGLRGRDVGVEGAVLQHGAPDDVLAAAALVLHAENGSGADPWDVADGWRIGERAWTPYRLESRGEVADVRVRGLVDEAEIHINERPLGAARLIRDGCDLLVTVSGMTGRYATARDRDTVWLGRDGHAWAVTRHELGYPGDRAGGSRTSDGAVRSPMPGTVLVVKAAIGESVSAGEPLLIVEAMKMEHTVTAPVAGVVSELPVRAGQSVDMDAVLAVVVEAES